MSKSINNDNTNWPKSDFREELNLNETVKSNMTKIRTVFESIDTTPTLTGDSATPLAQAQVSQQDDFGSHQDLSQESETLLTPDFQRLNKIHKEIEICCATNKNTNMQTKLVELRGASRTLLNFMKKSHSSDYANTMLPHAYKYYCDAFAKYQNKNKYLDDFLNNDDHDFHIDDSHIHIAGRAQREIEQLLEHEIRFCLQLSRVIDSSHSTNKTLETSMKVVSCIIEKLETVLKCFKTGMVEHGINHLTNAMQDIATHYMEISKELAPLGLQIATPNYYCMFLKAIREDALRATYDISCTPIETQALDDAIDELMKIANNSS